MKGAIKKKKANGGSHRKSWWLRDKHRGLNWAKIIIGRYGTPNISKNSLTYITFQDSTQITIRNETTNLAPILDTCPIFHQHPTTVSNDHSKTLYHTLSPRNSTIRSPYENAILLINNVTVPGNSTFPTVNRRVLCKRYLLSSENRQ